MPTGQRQQLPPPPPFPVLTGQVSSLPRTKWTRRSVNNYRTMTGRGFAFLSIPRSYYGALTAESLCADSGASPGLAGAVLAALQDCGLVGTSGVVDLDIAEDAMHALALPAEHARELEEKRAAVWAAVSRGRYRNMFLLLREQVSHPPPSPPPPFVLIGHAVSFTTY